jgi:hypothetical protein
VTLRASGGIWRSAADLGSDIRYAWRGLVRTPAFLAVAVLSLGLGIGANTAIFSLIDTVMLRTLPVRAPEQLVEQLTHSPGDPRMNNFGWHDYRDFRDRNDVFSSLVAAAPSRTPFQVSRHGSPAEPVDVEFVVGDFFAVLGMTPAIGRLIDVEDDRPDRSAVALVSWPYWTRESGIRMALGATPRGVVRMVLRNAGGLIAGGLAIGLPLSAWSRRLAAGMVPGLRVEALPIITVATLIMIAAGLLAAYLPARRAARVQPLEALRHE